MSWIAEDNLQKLQKIAKTSSGRQYLIDRINSRTNSIDQLIAPKQIPRLVFEICMGEEKEVADLFAANRYFSLHGRVVKLVSKRLAELRRIQSRDNECSAGAWTAECYAGSDSRRAGRG